MKVITADGAQIDLGTVEAAPTISIIDYSRRETDDFGVTTVVKRGFARRLSVRLALPFDQVDAVQRQLADLRATPAQWVADDRFAWLNFEGFYKDFELDLAVPPLSYCTLTVEGLAETAPGADAGGDPAPAGSTSSLLLLQPAEVNGAVLAASSVAENEQPEWTAGATYATGVRVIRSATHRVYESLSADNRGNDPASDPSRWLDVGPTNRWAMFDQALGTSTVATGNITVTLNASNANALALLDVIASAVRVQAPGYDRTQMAGAGAVTFLDLPSTTGQILVTITGAGQVGVGTLLIGRMVSLGITEASPTAGILDFSRKETDAFGEVTIVPRAWAKRMSARALLRTDAVDQVANRIAAVRATPCLWIGDDGLDSLTVYGFFKEFSIEVGENVSTLSLSIEGLSEAAKPGVLAPNWTDVVDNDPARPKPEDGATVGAPAGTPVAGRPAEQVVGVIDDAVGRVDALEEFRSDAETQVAGLHGDLAQARSDIAQARTAIDAETDRAKQDVQSARSDLSAATASAQADATAARAEAATVKGDLASEVTRAKADTASIRTVQEQVQADVSGNTSRIATEETNRANADGALANRAQTLEATVNTGPNSNSALRAGITDEATARSTTDAALAGSLSAVEARAGRAAVSYLACASGNPAYYNGVPAGRRGLYDGAGNQLDAASRGYTVYTFHPETSALASARSFDTYGESDTEGADPAINGTLAMANYLNGLPTGTGLAIVTHDEPNTHRLANGLPAAMERCGAGDLFSSPNFQPWGAYILLGYAGAGRAGGQEFYRGSVSQDLNAWLQQPFSVLLGRPLAVSDRQTSAVNARVVTEEAVRAAADGSLATRATNLEATVNTGPNRNTALRAGISDEATARADADSALATRASSLEARAGGLEGQVGGISSASLQSRIGQEETARANADGALATRAADLEATVNTGPNRNAALRAGISDEATARADGDSALAGRASLLEARAGSLEGKVGGISSSELQSRIATEETTRANADGALAGRASTLEAKAVKAGVSYTAVSSGNQARMAGNIPNGWEGSLYDGAGVMVAWSQRGYTVCVFADDNTLLDHQRFDTYGSNANAGAMAAYLNALPRGRGVAITTYDEPSVNHLENGLGDAMARCGAGDLFLSPTTMLGNSAYMLLGYAGAGRSNGQEFYKGDVPQDVTAWLVQPFTVIGGRPAVGSGKMASTVNARVATEEAARASGDSALATRSANLEATVNTGPNSNTALRSGITDEASARYNADSALATRTLTLENQFLGDFDSPLFARLRTEETARTNGDSALAGRASSLEARAGALEGQVGGISSAALQARVATEETTRANADGALAGRAANLEARDARTAVDYLACSYGNPAYYGSPGVPGNLRGLYDGAGNQLDPGGRSYTIYTFDGSNNGLAAVKRFDVYGLGEAQYNAGGPGANDAGAMAAYLNALPVGTGIVVVAMDEPAAYRLSAGLQAAMERCGAGDMYSSPNFQGWGAYILLGYAGADRSGGQEFYKGAFPQDPTAWIQVPFSVLRGRPTFSSDRQAATVNARVASEEAVRANADGALASRASSLEARAGSLEGQVGSVSSPALQSRIAAEETARANADGALALRATSLEAKATVTPTAYTIRARGGSAGSFGAEGLYRGDGSQIAGSARSYVVSYKSTTSDSWVVRAFDVHGQGQAQYSPGGPGANDAAAMAAYLNGIPDGTIVVIHTADEPASWRTSAGLQAAMERCGAGNLFSSPTFRFRAAYALVGKAGGGFGSGLEWYAGLTDSDVNARFEVSFGLLGNSIMTPGTGGLATRDLTARVAVNEGAIAAVDGRTQAHWALSGSAGNASFAIEARAISSPGGPTQSSVGIVADEFSVKNSQSRKSVLRIAGQEVLIDGNLTATSGIFLGSGVKWQVALRQKTYSLSDGQAVSFAPLDLGNYVVEFAGDGLAPLAAGETYKFYADAKTGTGFTPRLKIVTPGASSSVNISGSSASGSGPARQLERGSNNEATNGAYTLTVGGTYSGYAYNYNQ